MTLYQARRGLDNRQSVRYYYHIGYSLVENRGLDGKDMAHLRDEDQGSHRLPRDVTTLLPLTLAVFHILLALSDGERHGYSIMREIERYTNGQLRLGATTLYRSIKQVLAAGLIEEADERPDPALDDERRRYYRLTPLGQLALRAETQRLAALVALAHAKGVVSQNDVPGLSLGGAL
jgi:DNA-binding PadR family transcriptional regulator